MFNPLIIIIRYFFSCRSLLCALKMKKESIIYIHYFNVFSLSLSFLFPLSSVLVLVHSFSLVFFCCCVFCCVCFFYVCTVAATTAAGACIAAAANHCALYKWFLPTHGTTNELMNEKNINV